MDNSFSPNPGFDISALDLSDLLSADAVPDKTQMLAFYRSLLPLYDLVCMQGGLQSKIAQKRLKSILDYLESLIVSLPD